MPTHAPSVQTGHLQRDAQPSQPTKLLWPCVYCLFSRVFPVTRVSTQHAYPGPCLAGAQASRPEAVPSLHVRCRAKKAGNGGGSFSAANSGQLAAAFNKSSMLASLGLGRPSAGSLVERSRDSGTAQVGARCQHVTPPTACPAAGCDAWAVGPELWALLGCW